MKKLLWSFVIIVLFAGCSSYTDIGKVVVPFKTDDSEEPIATITVANVSYSLFGVWPIESGTTWKKGPYAKRPKWNGVWFEDNCTIDENLASIKAAMNEIGSNHIMNLVTDADSWRFWSLFIIKRTVIKSSCTVLKQL